MGVRRAALRRILSARTLHLALALGAASAAIVASARSEPNAAWWRTPPEAPRAITAEPVRWFDMVDVTLGAAAASDGRLGADVSLRVRLDAVAAHARRSADASDLAELTAALERQRWHNAQLDWFMTGCIGAWRGWQVALLDGAMMAGRDGQPESADVTEAALLARLLGLSAGTPADADTAAVCRLDGSLADLRITSAHPVLESHAAERRLNARSADLVATPPPASLWLHGNISGDPYGSSTTFRLGLDVPLPVAAGSSEATLSSAGDALELRWRWQHVGAQAPRSLPTPSGRDDSALIAELERQLLQRQIESQLYRLDADTRWREVCSVTVAHGVIACLEAGLGDVRRLDLFMVAVDAEIAALQSAFATVDTAGVSLATLMADR